MTHQPSDELWNKLATSLGIEVPVLKAVAYVESSGSGFLPSSSKPKVLFEGHVFHRLTGGIYDDEYPNLSYRKWSREKYSGSLAGEWRRLEAACQLNRPAALQSASWGMFQIMGFNYAYCGCPDVEAFVAMQYAGVDEQTECFARFIARPPFLEAPKSKDWETFAAAYNGPAHAKNNYVGKLSKAYEQARSEQPAAERPRAARTRAKRTKTAMPPGRPAFAPVQSFQRRTARRRNVRPDPVDLRDWEYRPSIAVAPPETLLPNDPRRPKDQGETNACTGFALATVIEYLLVRAGRPAETISGFMLYSMARRYDEWSEADENDDTGSSLRGALKGWARHGASIEALWKTSPMPKAKKPKNGKAEWWKGDWWLDAVKRPMGAYYRIAPENIRDIHVALREAGAVYASAFTHDGWDALLGDEELLPPTSADELPIIEPGKGNTDQGHAFAIVGYTQKGFIVQNSWGPCWGRAGLAVLPYSDWLQNAMDCWVVQLGVVTVEHETVAREPTIRIGPAGRAVLSSNETLANHEIAPFVINMENEGRLSQRGRFRTKDDDLEALLLTHLRCARARWGIAPGEPVDVAIYAHGGLTNEDTAAAAARAWIPHLYTHRIFPVFIMWETGAIKTLRNLFEDFVKGEEELAAAGGRLERFRERLSEWKDARLEGLVRFPGGKMWREMKQNASALSGHPHAGLVKLFRLFQRDDICRAIAPIRLHLIGHSAGSIVHAHLGERAARWIANRKGKARVLELSSLSFLAPALRLDEFVARLGPIGVADGRIPVLIANLTDAAERTDESCRPYGRSLLYLVSRSFEDPVETPLVGMERHLVPALATSLWNAQIRQLPCPGGSWDARSAATRATTHGGVDDDPAVRQAVASFIRESASSRSAAKSRALA